MDQPNTSPSPAAIMQTGTAFWASKILLSAIRFELFTKLAAAQSMSGRDIKEALSFNCTDRHLYDYLDALTAFGFLKRDGVLETAVYSNGGDTAVFLDKAKPSYEETEVNSVHWHFTALLLAFLMIIIASVDLVKCKLAGKGQNLICHTFPSASDSK